MGLPGSNRISYSIAKRGGATGSGDLESTPGVLAQKQTKALGGAGSGNRIELAENGRVIESALVESPLVESPYVESFYDR